MKVLNWFLLRYTAIPQLNMIFHYMIFFLPKKSCFCKNLETAYAMQNKEKYPTSQKA